MGRKERTYSAGAWSDTSNVDDIPYALASDGAESFAMLLIEADGATSRLLGASLGDDGWSLPTTLRTASGIFDEVHLFSGAGKYVPTWTEVGPQGSNTVLRASPGM